MENRRGQSQAGRDDEENHAVMTDALGTARNVIEQLLTISVHDRWYTSSVQPYDTDRTEFNTELKVHNKLIQFPSKGLELARTVAVMARDSDPTRRYEYPDTGAETVLNYVLARILWQRLYPITPISNQLKSLRTTTLC